MNYPCKKNKEENFRKGDKHIVGGRKKVERTERRLVYTDWEGMRRHKSNKTLEIT